MGEYWHLLDVILGGDDLTEGQKKYRKHRFRFHCCYQLPTTYLTFFWRFSMLSQLVFFSLHTCVYVDVFKLQVEEKLHKLGRREREIF